MKRPAVFFDRDNTLIISDGYLGDPSKVALVDGAAEAVARARQLGYATVVFSNQSGVARGMFAEDAVHAVNAKMDEQLLDANSGAVIDRHEFCPFHPEATVEAYRQESPLRKPRPGMILQAAEKLALDLSRSWVVGDAPRDVEAGHAAGCRTILIRNPALPPSPAANSASDVEPSFVVGSLREAIAMIARETEGAAPAEPPEPVGKADASDLVVALGPEASAPAAAAPAPISVAPSAPTVAEKRTPAAGATQSARRDTDEATRATAEADRARPSRAEPPAPAAPSRPAAPAPSPGPAASPGPAPSPAPSAAPSPRPTSVPEPTVAPRPVAEAPPSTEAMEALLEQILLELRREGEHHHSDFSVSKLLAGVLQPVALAVLFFAYFRQGDAQIATLLTALILQTFTVALLIMGRQR